MNTNKNAKRILVYGDSHTWGRIANKPARYDASIRFTGVLQTELGNNFEVIEEGLRGRTVKGENLYFEDRDGYKQFTGIYSSHMPIDILIIFLGTNDTNLRANKSSDQIVNDLESYLGLIKNAAELMDMNTPEKVVFVGIPFVDETVLKNSDMFKGASAKSSVLPKLIEDMATRNDCHYFDASIVFIPCDEDGIHLNAESNIRLGKELAKFIVSI